MDVIYLQEGQAAHVVMGSGDIQYRMGVDADGSFEIKQGEDVTFLSVTKGGNVILR